MEDDGEFDEGFEYADDGETAEDLGEDPGNEGTSADDDDTDESDEEATPAETGGDDEDDAGPPAATGDRKSDGIAKGQRAVRERARKAERENAELRHELSRVHGRLDQLAASRAQQQQPAEEEEDEVLDIDYSDIPGSVGKIATKKAEKIAKGWEKQRASESEASWQRRLSASVKVAKGTFDDFDAVAKRFIDRQDPELNLLVREQPDPAEWAYRNQKRFEKRQKEGSSEVEQLRKRLAEIETKQTRAGKPVASRTLANARGGGPRSRGSTGTSDNKAAFAALFK